ncbi:MAG: PfkB family carbohydrate kinase [Piscinibacter sp.]
MFVVCGEALFDVFATGDTPTGMAMDARVGGSPFNVAVGLARLAQPVAFLSQVSNGFLGERLMKTLAAEGVNTSTVQRSAAPTTLSLIGLDAQGVPSYSFYGEGCADRLLTEDALATLPATDEGDQLRFLRHGGRPHRADAACAGRTRAGPHADRLRPQHPAQRRAGAGRLAPADRLDAAAHPAAQGQRRGPASGLARPGAGRTSLRARWRRASSWSR